MLSKPSMPTGFRTKHSLVAFVVPKDDTTALWQSNLLTRSVSGREEWGHTSSRQRKRYIIASNSHHPSSGSLARYLNALQLNSSSPVSIQWRIGTSENNSDLAQAKLHPGTHPALATSSVGNYSQPVAFQESIKAGGSRPHSPGSKTQNWMRISQSVSQSLSHKLFFPSILARSCSKTEA